MANRSLTGLYGLKTEMARTKGTIQEPMRSALAIAKNFGRPFGVYQFMSWLRSVGDEINRRAQRGQRSPEGVPYRPVNVPQIHGAVRAQLNKYSDDPEGTSAERPLRTVYPGKAGDKSGTMGKTYQYKFDGLPGIDSYGPDPAGGKKHVMLPWSPVFPTQVPGASSGAAPATQVKQSGFSAHDEDDREGDEDQEQAAWDNPETTDLQGWSDQYARRPQAQPEEAPEAEAEPDDEEMPPEEPDETGEDEFGFSDDDGGEDLEPLPDEEPEVPENQYADVIPTADPEHPATDGNSQIADYMDQFEEDGFGPDNEIWQQVAQATDWDRQVMPLLRSQLKGGMVNKGAKVARLIWTNQGKKIQESRLSRLYRERKTNDEVPSPEKRGLVGVQRALPMYGLDETGGGLEEPHDFAVKHGDPDSMGDGLDKPPRQL